jgi:hypothetical protein
MKTRLIALSSALLFALLAVFKWPDPLSFAFLFLAVYCLLIAGLSGARARVVALSLIVPVLLAIAFAPKVIEPTAFVQQAAPTPSATPGEVARLLAKIDRNSEAAAYESLLKDLREKCYQSQMDLADISVAYQQFMEKNGTKLKNYVILSQLHSRVAVGPPLQDCKAELIKMGGG